MTFPGRSAAIAGLTFLALTGSIASAQVAEPSQRAVVLSQPPVVGGNPPATRSIGGAQPANPPGNGSPSLVTQPPTPQLPVPLTRSIGPPPPAPPAAAPAPDAAAQSSRTPPENGGNGDKPAADPPAKAVTDAVSKMISDFVPKAVPDPVAKPATEAVPKSPADATPKRPATAGAPDKAPDAAGSPRVPDGAKTADSAKPGEAPKSTDSGKSTDTVKAADTVKAPETAKTPDVPKATGAAAVAAALPNVSSLRDLKRMSRDEILTAGSDGVAVYVLRDNERALVLDFPNTREQARMFARLILFVERAGTSKTRVMSVPEVQKWLVQNAQQFDTLTVGNNMRTSELARFYNSARFQGEPITVEEQRLYDWLVQVQLLREEEGGVAVVDPERILISVPQASVVAGCPGCSVNAAQRAIILQHELSHARFATDTVYQHYAIHFWSNVMSLSTRDKFVRFLRQRGYDASIRELCANEMQAFLMHTPDPAMFNAADLGVTDQELADLRRRFAEGLNPRPRAAVDKPYKFD